MQTLRAVFAPVVAVLSFINNYFKAMIFLLIIYLIFLTGQTSQIKTANLMEIQLSGAIMDESEILKKIYSASEDDSIKGVLLLIDSPGGALSPSVEISMAIKDLNNKKPVVAYAKGTMASGSYLSGVWAKKIIANPGSFIGSIGVIMQGMNIENLANKIGFSDQVVKAGEYKEAGTMMRTWTDSERSSLQKLVNDSYDFFVSEVATARKLDKTDADKWANARVFLAKDAKEMGLIDELGSYKIAQIETAKISGVSSPSWAEAPIYEKMMDKFSTKFINLGAKVLFPDYLSAR